MNLGDITNLVEKPFAVVSNIINTPNSTGRYRPFYLRNLLDAVLAWRIVPTLEKLQMLHNGCHSPR